MIVLDKFIKSIREAARYNQDVQVAPACILWPDHDRQWEAIIPRLQKELPELLILGDYAPEKRIGPAIWLRCVIAGKIGDVEASGGYTPILYLPGISRQDLRAVESCSDLLKPLVELQYRGVIWSQGNSKDWTILAFLKSKQGGLGLDVTQDNDSKNAMQLALYQLIDEDIELLKDKRLDKDYFNKLLTGGDPVRNLLQWLDQGDTFKTGLSENEWKAFIEVCKSQMAFDPLSEGVLAGAAKLAEHIGPWKPVWERFCEAPKRYPNIPAQIRKCKAPNDNIFWITEDDSYSGWPQWNEAQENDLREELKTLSNLPTHEACKKILEIEKIHGKRRQLVWTELGEAPLAQAMEYLAILAETTQNGLTAGTVDDLVAGYKSQGWHADDAVIRALSFVDKTQDCLVLSDAIRAVYLPWAEESARYLQRIISESTYPGGTVSSFKFSPVKEGECLLFVDGLRFDTAKGLVQLLEDLDYQVTEKITWAALPSVTSTGKPAVSPVTDKIRGQESNADFEPCVAETNQSLKGGHHLKKLLVDNDWIILEHSDNGNGQGNAWCEFGDIDHEGHNRGWKLAKQIEILLREIRDRITELIAAGWKSACVVTDHGWLLLPGGLPKSDISSALVDTKWGRCAAIKPGASTEERLFPWFWNPSQYFALADGISCFRSGEEYTHGGLSLQECLTLELTVTKASAESAVSVELTDIVWKGLRCTVAVDGQFSGLLLDLRTQAGDSSCSVVLKASVFKNNGTASVVVLDETLEGHGAILVLLDANGGLVAQTPTVIGGGSND